MSSPRRLVTRVLATGAGLLVTASMVGCAPDADLPDADTPAARTSASSTQECRSPRDVRGVAASRSLPRSGRRAVPPLRFPGFGASDRVALMPDVVGRSGGARAIGALAPLQHQPLQHQPLQHQLLLPPAAWTPPPLPWA
jgi:hypothetical protein